MVTIHVPVPLQPAPFHPSKVESASVMAVKVTWSFSRKSAVQVPGQLNPAGALLTEPLPVPFSVTVSGKVTGAEESLWQS